MASDEKTATPRAGATKPAERLARRPNAEPLDATEDRPGRATTPPAVPFLAPASRVHPADMTQPASPCLVTGPRPRPSPYPPFLRGFDGAGGGTESSNEEDDDADADADAADADVASAPSSLRSLLSEPRTHRFAPPPRSPAPDAPPGSRRPTPDRDPAPFRLGARESSNLSTCDAGSPHSRTARTSA